jgi:hypothetical protein
VVAGERDLLQPAGQADATAMAETRSAVTRG